MSDLKPHELATLFPPIADNELQALADDIRQHGVSPTKVRKVPQKSLWIPTLWTASWYALSTDSSDRCW